ncbi:MAG: lactonase family protein [Verrucomicrobiota bacterium]
MMKLISYLLFAVVFIGAPFSVLGEKRVWIASGGDGIYSARLDEGNFRLAGVKRVVDLGRVAYIAEHPRLDVLYAVQGNRGGNGRIFWFEKKANGELVERGSHVIGPEWCAALDVSPDGAFIALGDYAGGRTGVYSLDEYGAVMETVLEAQHEGSSVHPQRQTAPHPHWAGFSADSRFLFIPDLGTDEIWTYAMDAESLSVELVARQFTRAGSGPRHLAIHPNARFAYTTDELVDSVTAFRYDAETGNLHAIESLLAAEESKKERRASVSDLKVHPNGNFLYVVNRGFDAVSVFRINGKSGRLTPVEREHVRGTGARCISISPDGRWAIVCGSGSATVALFSVDGNTGELTYGGGVINVERPLAVVWD